jgi:diguanylate cyclase (GGDEF)-like protein
LARFGGEEFAVVLGQCSTVEAVDFADRLRAAMPAGHSCSAGVATWTPGERTQSVLERADKALYDAKAAGRDATRAAP